MKERSASLPQAAVSPVQSLSPFVSLGPRTVHTRSSMQHKAAALWFHMVAGSSWLHYSSAAHRTVLVLAACNFDSTRVPGRACMACTQPPVVVCSLAAAHTRTRMPQRCLTPI